MFGALMGTLTSFQRAESRGDKKASLRKEIEERVKERVSREKQKVADGDGRTRETEEGGETKVDEEVRRREEEEVCSLSRFVRCRCGKFTP